MAKAKPETDERPDDSGLGSSHCSTADRMKPVVVLQTETMSKDDIQVLRDNGICVVECDEPNQVRFMEPLPTGYDRCEWAAVQLFRKLMSQTGWQVGRREFATIYADILD